jgi:hypothetical protein
MQVGSIPADYDETSQTPLARVSGTLARAASPPEWLPVAGSPEWPQFPPLPGTCRSKPARRVPLNEGGADRNGGKGLYSRPWHATMPDLRLRIAADASCESCKNPMLST